MQSKSYHTSSKQNGPYYRTDIPEASLERISARYACESVRACTCVRVCVCTHVCTQVHTRTQTYRNMQAHEHVYIYEKAKLKRNTLFITVSMHNAPNFIKVRIA